MVYLMFEKERLYLDALMELAEAMGHSWEKPLSLSLLCLSHGVSYDEKEKIYLAFNRILNEYEFDELDIALFRNAMEKNAEVAKEFADVVVGGFIKAYAIELIPELYPFAMSL